MADIADQLTQAAYEAGFRGRELVRIVAIALLESGGQPNATAQELNPGPGFAPEYSVGPLQINLLAHGGNISEQQARDPGTAFMYAKYLRDRSGGFGDWQLANNALEGQGSPQLVASAAVAQQRATTAAARLGLAEAPQQQGISFPTFGLGGVADAAQGLSDVLAAVVSPRFWARIGLTLGAVAMIAAGGVLYFRRELTEIAGRAGRAAL